ncbi:MAG: Sua5/YciO/YrdC/YwlC family protein, partial [Planctomycetota bacterium]
GPLTVVIPSIFNEPIGLRVPGYKLTRDIIRSAGVPVVMPSANPAGLDPALRAEQVLEYFNDQIDIIVDDGKTMIGDPSTVVQIEENGYSVLRTGIISKEDIRSTACTTILFICTGNTCRSPMAEGLMKKMLADRLQCPVEELPTRGYLVLSAGVTSPSGEKPSRNAVKALQKWRIDISQHKTQPANLRVLNQADKIYVMTMAHKTALSQSNALFVKKIELLDRAGRDIIDPFGGSEAVYSRCASQIYSNIVEIMEKL